MLLIAAMALGPSPVALAQEAGDRPRWVALENQLQRCLLAGDANGAWLATRQLLAVYPPESRATPRRIALRLYLNARRFVEAELWIREFRAEGVAEADEMLMELAAFYKYAGRNEESIETYRELIRSYPRSKLVSQARLWLAMRYMADGQESVATEILRELAARPASFEGSEACETLAEHFTKKFDFPQALVYWERWRPRSSCGAEVFSRQRRLDRIEFCRSMLDADTKLYGFGPLPE